jgi:branched-subunit amino acid ABC-type transport system permease component
VGQQTIHSLALGSIYTLLAAGFTLMSTAHRCLYLAYGGLYTLGGYITWWAIRHDYSVWEALGFAAIACTLLGWLSYGLFHTVLLRASGVARLLTGLGLLLCSQAGYRSGIGPYHFKIIAFDSHQIHHIGPLMLTDAHWFVFGGAFVIFTALQGFLHASKSGRLLDIQMRHGPCHFAPAEMSWQWGVASGIGAALAGIAGVLGGVYLNEVYPAMGTMITHKVMAIVLIGAFGNLHSVVLTSFSLAVIAGVLLPATNLPIPLEAILIVGLAVASVVRLQDSGCGVKDRDAKI